jgi:hypothetical protein
MIMILIDYVLDRFLLRLLEVNNDDDKEQRGNSNERFCFLRRPWFLRWKVKVMKVRGSGERAVVLVLRP